MHRQNLFTKIGIAAFALASAFCLLPSAFPQTPIKAPQVSTNELDVQTAALAPVSQVSATVVGGTGNSTFYYWVVANYSTGQAAASSYAQVINAPNVLSASDYVAVSWSPAPGATTYDLLRTTSPTLPNTPATIAVAMGLTATSYNDQGAALSSYTLNPTTQGSCGLTYPNSVTGLEIGCNSTVDQNLNVSGSVTASSISSNASGANSLISGGAIYYTGAGYSYIVTAATYQIGGVTFNSPQTSITLSAADPTNPRIDVVYVDNTGSVGVLTGTPAVNPSEPSVDPTTQWALGFINVAAASTVPAGTSTANIYLEDAGPPAEWACSTSGTGWNCADSTKPYQGTKDIQSTGVSASSYVQLQNTSAISLSSYNILAFQMQTQSRWSGKDEVWATFYNGASPVGTSVFISSKSYGWNGQTAGSYQLVAVPITAFNLGTNLVDTLRIKWNSGGTTATNVTIYIDNIQLQQNGVGGGGSGGTGGSGTVTSVAMQGDGIIFNSVVPGSPVTSSGTLAPALNKVSSGFGLFGPIPAQGTNVGVVQTQTCTISTQIVNCAFSQPVSQGDYIVVVARCRAGSQYCTSDPSITDSEGLAYTLRLDQTPSSVYRASFWTSSAATSSANLTVTVNNIQSGPTGFVYLIEVAGTNGYYTGSSDNFAAPGNLPTPAITPNQNDGALIFTINSNSVPNADMSISPSSSTVAYLDGSAKIWLYGFGSSASQVFNINYSASSNPVVVAVMDFSNNPNAGSGTPVYRKITEGDLPPTAISALQSVQTFNMTSSSILITGVNTANTIISGTVSMPSQGCPCRIFVDYSLFWAESSGSVGDAWISDGTNSWAPAERKTQSGGGGGFAASGFSPKSYANGQSVTVTLYMASNVASTITVSQQPVNTVMPLESSMDVAVMQSQN